MRFSVECAFSHLRKRGVGSRKSAFCGCGVTEKRSLARVRRAHLTEKRTLRVGSHGKAHFGRAPGARPHQKAHSGDSGARRMRLSVTSNSRMRFSVECAFPHLRKRGVGSRKSALCALGLTEKRTLAAPRGRTSRKGALWLGRHLQNASLREAPHQKAHSGGSGARRMRLSVTSNSRMRFSVECAFSHLRKRGVGSRKSAFCPDGLTEKRSLHRRPHGKAHFGRAPGARLTKRRILAGASPPECVST